MKYRHTDGTEYEVAELAKFLELKANTRREGPIYQACSALLARHERVCEAASVLAMIADAYDANNLDDEARKTWGKEGFEVQNDRAPESIELYSGRGGKRLLTLADCFEARTALRGEEAKRG